ncbi:hypothetical protein [Salinisphaera japonica]|uniref:Uncharacterized protein n=1 Tax=Salinisphaera japonica YTM-1 TaxID=1209778 RepID=A0A423PH26_9GAMM|nr:hypothetical protein [Salinisphaera japonica]ROO24890.1 hypothetical protein SAJA_13795 [Salinisphaera japonica YTM-1]
MHLWLAEDDVPVAKAMTTLSTVVGHCLDRLIRAVPYARQQALVRFPGLYVTLLMAGSAGLVDNPAINAGPASDCP